MNTAAIDLGYSEKVTFGRLCVECGDIENVFHRLMELRDGLALLVGTVIPVTYLQHLQRCRRR